MRRVSVVHFTPTTQEFWIITHPLCILHTVLIAAVPQEDQPWLHTLFPGTRLICIIVVFACGLTKGLKFHLLLAVF